MARLRSAPTVQPSPPKAQNKRQALKEKTNTARAKAPIYEDDGNTEDLVKTATTRRGRPKKAAQNDDELVMAGGLGLADGEAPRSDAPMNTDELAHSDAPPPPTAKASRRPPRMTRKPVQNEAQSKVLEGLKKRMEATARKEAGRKDAPAVTTDDTAPSSDALPTNPPAARQSTSTAHERSEYSLSPSPPPPGKLSSVKDKRSSLAPPGSALRSQGTPLVESSILALKNFKRRPRQPSMLQMVQQRTVSARPSVAHAAADEDPSVFDFEAGEDEDADDFAPEAEGTPLHASKAKRRSSATAKAKQPARKPVQPSRKRKSEEIQPSFAKRRKTRSPRPARDDEALTARERSISATQPSQDRRALAPAPAPALDEEVRQRSPSARISSTPQPQITSDVQVNNSPPSSTPPTEPSSERDLVGSAEDFAVPSTEKERDDIEQYPLNNAFDDLEHDAPNGTMAEPASSSPMPEDPLSADEQAQILADPVTQITQVSPVRQRKESKKKAKPISTATLQSLLPKRRQPPKPRRRKTEYDFTSDEEEDGELDASHLEDDEDELGGRLRRQTKTAAPAKGRKSAAAAKAKGRQGKAAQQSAPVAPKSAAPSAAKGRPRKTYGRAGNTTSDKENQRDDDYDAIDEGEGTDLPEVSIHDAAQSKELEEAKRKFAEVDGWDMEFESMSAEDHRSSSQQWR